MNKIQQTEMGQAVYYGEQWHPCQGITGSLFLGNNDFPRAYCVAGTHITQKRIGENWYPDNEYHLFNEKIGKLSPAFMHELRDFIRENRIERLILACDDESMRYKIKKELGTRMIFEKEAKKKNSSVVLREWFARNKAGSEDSLLTISGGCSEAIKANYAPVRECMVKLLEHFDKRMRAKSSVPHNRSQRAGYG